MHCDAMVNDGMLQWGCTKIVELGDVMLGERSMVMRLPLRLLWRIGILPIAQSCFWRNFVSSAILPVGAGYPTSLSFTSID